MVQWINNWFDVGIDKPLENRVKDTEERYRSITLWVPYRLHRFATTSAFFQILGILSRSVQEKKTHFTTQ